MEPIKVYELINQKHLNHQDANFIERMGRRIQNGQPIEGRERVVLGKIYKKLFGVWPFDNSPEDIKRRQDTARMLLNAFNDAVEGGILELPIEANNFLFRMRDKQNKNELIEPKDFNYLFFLSKKFKDSLVAYLPNRKEGKGK